ncbi:MAG: hypothetical protein HQM09_08390 [Candidatus Riflebacteria bacterium]|nr:hypothetical protein [Candidatus Riflebacteria bacterium]
MTLVLRHIERKFGPLNESDRQRISEAEESTLIEWGECLIMASDLHSTQSSNIDLGKFTAMDFPAP